MAKTPLQIAARFRGVQATPITPFRQDMSLDADAVAANAERLIGDGAAGLVVCGSIGELPSLSFAEWSAVVGASAGAAGGRVPVLATVGHTDVRVVRDMLEAAVRQGADGAVVVPPYYYGITQAEVVAFYRSVDAVGVPFIVYSHPGTGRPEIGVAALSEIAGLANFSGLKEATSNGVEFLEKKRLLDGRLPVLAAAESYLFFMFAAGADGCLTAVSAFAPRFLIRFEQAFAQSDLQTARALNQRLMAFRALVHEESVGGRPGYITVAKCAAEMCGLAAGPVRPPLKPLPKERRSALEAILREALDVLG